MRDTLTALYTLLVVNKQKAIVGFLAGYAAHYLGRVGFTLDTTLGDVLQAGVTGAVSAAGVYIKSNR